MSRLLAGPEGLPPGVARPGYRPQAHGAGILHLGLGAFHRAHQAVYTDDALAAAGGDWRIIGANLHSRTVPEALAAQNGFYTVLERGSETRARIIAAHAATIAGDAAAVLRAACDPAIRIVTLTVSEKGYGIDRVAMDLDPAHPDVAADLAQPARPRGVLGLLTAALSARRAAGSAPFTLLSCDNLPDNGHLLRAGVLGFARRTDPDLADWIAGHVAFPCCMVDRITPAPSAATAADVMALTGREDRACVETEPFRQWVIEDRFPAGRPAWEAGGAQFTGDVRAWEAMKLRMLNGAHSLIAYAGQLAGLATVREVMADAGLAALIARHMRAAAATLPGGAGLDPEAYGRALAVRFANPGLAHATAQIAMDGTEKLPQRWFAPATELLVAGGDLRPYAFASALWLGWLAALAREGKAPPDPRGAQLLALAQAAGGDPEGLSGILALPGLAAPALRTAPGFRAPLLAVLARLQAEGWRATFDAELAA